MAFYIFRGFLWPWQNAVVCSQRAILTFHSGVTALCHSNGSLAHFFKIWTSWIGRGGWRPTADNNGCWHTSNSTQKCAIWPLLQYLQRAVTQQNSLQRSGSRRALKTVQALWCLISRPKLDLGIFKSLCHHKLQEAGCKEIQAQLA